MKKISLLASLAVMGIVTGCSSSKQPEYVGITPPLSGSNTASASTSPASTAPSDAAQPGMSTVASSAPSGHASNAPVNVHPSGTVVMPPGMSVGTAGNLTPTPDEDKRIATLTKQGKDKKALAAAYADRGYKRMMDDPASPRIKYRAALQDFRAALKYDPANAKAQQNKALIEGIYRSMNRSIPQ